MVWYARWFGVCIMTSAARKLIMGTYRQVGGSVGYIVDQGLDGTDAGYNSGADGNTAFGSLITAFNTFGGFRVERVTCDTVTFDITVTLEGNHVDDFVDDVTLVGPPNVTGNSANLTSVTYDGANNVTTWLWDNTTDNNPPWNGSGTQSITLTPPSWF